MTYKQPASRQKKSSSRTSFGGSTASPIAKGLKSIITDYINDIPHQLQF
jgi:hypothetical protein